MSGKRSADDGTRKTSEAHNVMEEQLRRKATDIVTQLNQYYNAFHGEAQHVRYEALRKVQHAQYEALRNLYAGTSPFENAQRAYLLGHEDWSTETTFDQLYRCYLSLNRNRHIERKDKYNVRYLSDLWGQALVVLRDELLADDADMRANCFETKKQNVCLAFYGALPSNIKKHYNKDLTMSELRRRMKIAIAHNKERVTKSTKQRMHEGITSADASAWIKEEKDTAKESRRKKPRREDAPTNDEKMPSQDESRQESGSG